MPSSGMVRRVALRSVHLFLVTAKVVPRSLVLSTLIVEEQRSSETSFLTIVKRSHISEHGIP
jgi:hypothetical protein